MIKKIAKYLLIFILGIALAIGYSFLIKSAIDLETVIMFIILYAYMIFFIKLLSRLFR